MSASPFRFDSEYYRRFYLNAQTRIYDRRRQWTLVSATVQLADWFGVRIRTVLDVGAGVGWWGQWFKKHRPDVRVLSTEFEPETCEKYGHLQADISSWRMAEQFDLVICQGVLPYLDTASAKKAIDNLGAMSRGLMYLEAITKADTEGSVDPSLTDMRIHRRPGSWYRKALKPHFRQVGAGLWAKRDGDVIFYELEAAEPD